MTQRQDWCSVKNSDLRSGSLVTWHQYPSRDAKRADRTSPRSKSRPRTGSFWSLAPGSGGAIWVRPDVPVAGEPTFVKVYRTLRSGIAEVFAYDDDLAAVAS